MGQIKAGGCMRVGVGGGGGSVWNTLQRGETEKGGETKILKKVGKLGQGVGALKREGWNPLTNYVLDNSRHNNLNITILATN